MKEFVTAGPRINLSFAHLTIEPTGVAIRALLLRRLEASTALQAAKYNLGLSPVDHLVMMSPNRSAI